MPELTQLEWERRHLAASQARERLLWAIARQPELLDLWRAWRASEQALVDAARARREAEVFE